METNNSIKLDPTRIADIAEDLDCGMCVFYHLPTGEVKTLIDIDNESDLMDEDMESWEEIEANRQDYYQIEKMDSHDSFNVMEEFAEQVSDNKFKTRLYNALNKTKPFRNFKFEIDKNWDYRQDWFDFKKQKLIAWVEKQIDNFNQIQPDQD